MEFSGHRKIWEGFRADARRRDAELDSKISKLETSASSCDGTNFAAFAASHDEVCAELQQLRDVVSSMMDIIHASDSLPGAAVEAAAMQRATQRFEDVCVEKQASLRRLMAEAIKRKEKSELLRNVRSEIQVFDESAEMRSLANENTSLRHTQRQTRVLIEQAETNRQQLRAQREIFDRIGGRALSIAEQVPVIKDLLKRIDSKRRREAVVIGGVIALCLLLIFIFW